MTWPQIYDALSAISLAQWVVVLIILLVSHGIAYLVFIRWALRRTWQLHQHLRRPIVLLQPINATGGLMPGGDLSETLRLLKKNGFLNVQDGVRDHRTFEPGKGHCIVVLGYQQGMAGIDDLLARIKTKHVPLVVYTYGNNAVSGSDKAAFDSYPYTLYANFPLTLLNSIFATVSSYPYE
jgi:hypothetical protein